MYRSADIATRLLQIKPRKHLFALMVDGYFAAERGEDYLDFAQRECYLGSCCCLKSLCKAYAYVLSNDFRVGDLTIEKLNNIHLLSGGFMFAAEEANKHNIDPSKYLPRNIRSRKIPLFAGYRLGIKLTLSENGLKDLMNTIKSKGKDLGIALVPTHYFDNRSGNTTVTDLFKRAYKDDDAIRYDNINKYKYNEILQKSKSGQYMYMAPYPIKVPALLEKALHILNKNIASSKRCNNDKNKIKHIRQFVAAGIKIHPWFDFNLRTLQCFEFGVLMREGILPSVKYVPSRICHYTEKEMIKEYQRDRITTKNLIKNSTNGPKYDNANRLVGCGRLVTVYQDPDGYKKRHKKIHFVYGGTYDEHRIYKEILSPFDEALKKLASQAKEIGYRPRRSNICGCCFPWSKKKGYTPL